MPRQLDWWEMIWIGIISYNLSGECVKETKWFFLPTDGLYIVFCLSMPMIFEFWQPMDHLGISRLTSSICKCLKVHDAPPQKKKLQEIKWVYDYHLLFFLDRFLTTGSGRIDD